MLRHRTAAWSRTGAGTGVDNEQDSEDLGTAAARLGLTVETVRKRLQRGRIKGFKAPDGTWRVTLDKVDNKQDSPGQAAGQEQDKPGQEQDKPGQGQDKAVQVRDDLVDQLRSENAFLRSQLQTQAQAHNDVLQRRDEEIRRVHVLLQQEQQQVKALTDQRDRRPWWDCLFSRKS
jgi:hypothetical protein